MSIGKILMPARALLRSVRIENVPAAIFFTDPESPQRQTSPSQE